MGVENEEIEDVYTIHSMMRYAVCAHRFVYILIQSKSLFVRSFPILKIIPSTICTVNYTLMQLEHRN